MSSDADADRYRSAAQILHDVAKPMRVLSALAWPAELRDQFLAEGAQRLPEPTYDTVDPTTVIDGVDAVRRILRPGHVVDDWLGREAEAVESTALMLASRGTPAFHAYSRRLYGVPSQPLRYDPATPLDLAHRVHEAIGELHDAALLRPVLRTRTGAEVAAFIEDAVHDHFGDDAPEVVLVDELSANATASTSRIKIRRDAKFTQKDAAQLLNHEAFIHVATGLNGRAQTDIPILAIGHPGTTRTQEGLAVYSEYVSGTLGMDRLRRLADRIVAVQMVIDGADFIELYRWFLERSGDPEQAFESTRRIFRGAPMTGGAPFTKDCSYLSGYLGIATLIRAAFRAGRADTIGLLFAGKLDLFAIPALAELRRLGLVRPARFAPPWATDPGWILSHLTLMTFMADIDLSAVTSAIADLLDHCPRIETHLPEQATG
ncbi:MAG TPA: flavohemoglobin expression-modulating QEGLA motif protein [Ilumatobacteraceae bacterium]|nr:flavohemoglobin expression-modulating QEGLA motif protein [Ilumatobacteraceae bacterium]